MASSAESRAVTPWYAEEAMSSPHRKPNSHKRKRLRRPKAGRERPDRRAASLLGDSSFIADSIENMYRIVEPWQKQGEEVARKFSRSYGAVEMPAGASDLQGRMLQSSGELLANLIDLMGLYTDWALHLPDTLLDGGHHAAHRSRDHNSEQLPVAIETTSRKTVRVRVRLDQQADGDDLRTSGLKSKSGVRVRFSDDRGLVVAHVKVGKKAKPGQYASDIIDDHTGGIVGRVRIKVRE